MQIGQSLRVAALPQTRHHGLLGQHGLLGFAASVLDGSQLDELVHRFQFTQSVHLDDEEKREKVTSCRAARTRAPDARPHRKSIQMNDSADEEVEGSF